MISSVRAAVWEQHPLIHCITNPISINQCANAILAVGARPIMAEHPQEAAEITATAGALLLNLGNITDVRMESMRISADTAQKQKIPFVLDLVGIACSKLRHTFAGELLKQSAPAVIKGNYSEIQALYQCGYHSSGVDADASLTQSAVRTAAAALACRYHTVVLASGPTDLVTDGTRMLLIQNGTPQLASVTGTGCMLGALCASYLAVGTALSAAAAACAVLGISGERAATACGSGSFGIRLMDQLSTLTDPDLKKYLKLEETDIEKL